MTSSWRAHDGHQTGKLPDKAPIISWQHSRLITRYYDVLCGWEQAGHHSGDNGDQSDAQCEWPSALMIGPQTVLMPWDRLSLANLWSWWWRKLNHLLIEDDKEPTHLCYPQWSRSHTMTTRQSLNNPPNIQLSPATDNEISTHAVSISDKKRKAFPREWFTWMKSFYHWNILFFASLFSLTQLDLIIVFICLSIAPCSLFVPVLSFLSASWCYEGDKSVI